jgi:hypothetical protein
VLLGFALPQPSSSEATCMPENPVGHAHSVEVGCGAKHDADPHDSCWYAPANATQRVSVELVTLAQVVPSLHVAPAQHAAPSTPHTVLSPACAHAVNVAARSTARLMAIDMVETLENRFEPTCY